MSACHWVTVAAVHGLEHKAAMSDAGDLVLIVPPCTSWQILFCLSFASHHTTKQRKSVHEQA